MQRVKKVLKLMMRHLSRKYPMMHLRTVQFMVSVKCRSLVGLPEYSLIVGLPEYGLMCHQQHIALPLQLHHHWLKPEQQF